jgi:folylpolyglutamate synthase/dihydropteroate synthase
VTLPQQPQANDVIGNTILDLGARGVSAVSFVPPVSPASAQYLVASGQYPVPSTQYPVPGTQRDATAASLEAGSSVETVSESVVHLAAERRQNAAHGVSRGFDSPTDQVREGRKKRAFAGPISRYPLQVMGKQILVETPLVGRHQLRNVALAIATAEELSKQGFPITPDSIAAGIRETRWAGRFQVIPSDSDSPEYVLDVAHNPAGAWALRSTLSNGYEDRPFTLIFGAMRDKAIGEVAEILFPLAQRVIITRADNPRAATLDEIRQAAVRTSTEIMDAPDVAAALEQARKLEGAKGLVVVTGSIYIVGEAMRQLGARI